MPCLCFASHQRSPTVFYWPNFTFARSQDTFNLRRTYSYRPSTHRRTGTFDEKATSYLPKKFQRRRSGNMPKPHAQPSYGPSPGQVERQEAGRQRTAGPHVTFAGPTFLQETYTSKSRPKKEDSVDTSVVLTVQNRIRVNLVLQAGPATLRLCLSRAQSGLRQVRMQSYHRGILRANTTTSRACSGAEVPLYESWFQVPSNAMRPPSSLHSSYNKSSPAPNASPSAA